MSAILLTPPVVEPLSVDDAKIYLRVDTPANDDLIAALIAGARIHLESQTRRAFISQTWRHRFDAWPVDGEIALRPAPLQAVTAVRVADGQGGVQSLDLQSFIVDGPAGFLNFMPGSLAAPGQIAGGIEIDVTAGYGDGAADIPEPLRQAIRMLVAHWYDNRGLAAVGQTVAILPQNVAALIAPFRLVSL